LLAIWLGMPPFQWYLDLPWGTWAIRKVELVRWVPFLIGLAVYGRRFFGWRWIDAPVVAFCLCPLLAGIGNQRGWSHSAWECAKEFSYWCIPYLLGRFVFDTESARRVLASSVVIGAVLYLPPIALEILHGPVLVGWMTGDATSLVWRGAARGTTFRPAVFLGSGFVLTMFLVWAVLIVLHRLGMVLDGSAWPPRWKAAGVPLIVAVGLSATVLACRSLGSILLMVTGILATAAFRGRLRIVPLAVLALVPLAYLGSRISGTASTERIGAFAKQWVSEERAGSLAYRFRAEDQVLQKMAGHWILGYGDWGLWNQGQDSLALDGFWLFLLTRTGLLSIVAWLAMVWIPFYVIVLALARRPSRFIGTAAEPCALFLALSMVDSLFNYFSEAPVMLCVGLVTTWALQCRDEEAGIDSPVPVWNPEAGA
jgi:hypothetical protein